MSARCTFTVDILLTREQIERFYAGSAHSVVATDTQGVRVSFPLSALRPYVGHDGVRGRFQLHVDANQRLQSFTRI